MVSRGMRTAKDKNGERLFNSNEFLTSRQVASFFSRLASKRSVDVGTDSESQSDDEDQNEAEKEARQHPIVYDAHNICDLVKNSMLSKFSIKMLDEICSSFGLDVSKINVKKKKP